MSKIRCRMTKPFISIALIVAENECSAASNTTHADLISNRMEEDGTEEDR